MSTLFFATVAAALVAHPPAMHEDYFPGVKKCVKRTTKRIMRRNDRHVIQESLAAYGV